MKTDLENLGTSIDRHIKVYWRLLHGARERVRLARANLGDRPNITSPEYKEYEERLQKVAWARADAQHFKGRLNLLLEIRRGD